MACNILGLADVDCSGWIPDVVLHKAVRSDAAPNRPSRWAVDDRSGVGFMAAASHVRPNDCHLLVLQLAWMEILPAQLAEEMGGRWLPVLCWLCERMVI